MSIQTQIVEQKMIVFNAIVKKKVIIVNAIVKKKKTIDNIMRRIIEKKQIVKDE